MSSKNFGWTFGNIGLQILLFLAIGFVVLFFLPPQLSPRQEENCLVGDAPSSPEYLDLPAAVAFNEEEISLYEIHPHVLVRKNVPVSAKSAKEGEENWVVIDGNRTKAASSILRHTINVGEYANKPGYDLVIPNKDGGVYTGPDQSGEGLYRRYVLLIQREPILVNDQKIFIADVYVRKVIYDEQVATDSVNNIFKCLAGSDIDPGSIYFPEQKESVTEEELQLEYFLLQKYNMLAMHCKPAVYLYPPKAKMVNVKVFPSGILSYTDPIYDEKNGWNVLAYPHGQLVSYTTGSLFRMYDYLYFESMVPDSIIKKPSLGWVIKSGSSDSDWFSAQEQFFKEMLPNYGLNQEQTTDFIEYWRKTLPYSPYYFIGMIDQDNIEKIERLEITPQPDSVNRVRVYFERLDQHIDVSPPDFSDDLTVGDSNLFRVVEWGGMVKLHPDKPFTCSQ